MLWGSSLWGRSMGPVDGAPWVSRSSCTVGRGGALVLWTNGPTVVADPFRPGAIPERDPLERERSSRRVPASLGSGPPYREALASTKRNRRSDTATNPRAIPIRIAQGRAIAEKLCPLRITEPNPRMTQ
jgi:hypothetical protein